MLYSLQARRGGNRAHTVLGGVGYAKGFSGADF